MFEILDTPMHGQQARARNRLLKLFKDRYQNIEDRRIVLLKKYGALDDKGELKLDSTGLKYEMTNQEEFSKEYQLVLDETVSIAISNSELSDFKVIREIVLNWSKALTIAETEMYEEICLAFEKI